MADLERRDFAEPYALWGSVVFQVGRRDLGMLSSAHMTPDEARLFALKLIKAADKAEDEA